MGATTFTTRSRGTSAKDAYTTAVMEALWANGHDGYTGTIADAEGFRIISAPATYATNAKVRQQFIADLEDRSDKYAPCFAFEVPQTRKTVTQVVELSQPPKRVVMTPATPRPRKDATYEVTTIVSTVGERGAGGQTVSTVDAAIALAKRTALRSANVTYVVAIQEQKKGMKRTIIGVATPIIQPPKLSSEKVTTAEWMFVGMAPY